MKRRDFVRGAVAAGAVTALGSLRALPAWASAHPTESTRLDEGWRFHLGDVAGAESPHFDDGAWERVTLPHTPRIEALVTGAPGSPREQWQGLCWYRRTVRVGAESGGRQVLLKFEGALNDADVFIDGEHVARHLGGFLPFVIDISDRIRGDEVELAVRLDNRDDPITGPKPLRMLDFNTYGGLYRYVHLIVKDRLHITDPILANRPGSGGVFVTYPRVSRDVATVRVQVHVENRHDDSRSARVRATLLTTAGEVVTSAVSGAVTLASGADAAVVQELTVRAPRLWSPKSPHLYVLRTEVIADGRVVDVEHTRIGIRRIEIVKGLFRINGERMFLRGTNAHQEHPYVGYAVPEDAQYRDVRRIKDAGFDYIRLSHYPHAPAYMDACDELGIVVMDSIPGWQYFNPDPAFAELQYRNCREMIRRDRNHPCVVLWEVSLNETGMPPEFIAKTNAIAHEEYPGDQCYTCGWMHGYDVYIRARQHGGCPPDATEPCLVSEYGDWEYYAMTAGLDQDAWKALTPAESNSRQLRWQGERAQLQQATNFQEAHNDNRGTDAFGDGLWVMYDYNRGYAPDIESSGCADILRVPKYSYHFFRSQRDASERFANADGGPMVFIASEWTAGSATRVRVFSNCDEVELRRDGRVVARQRPDRDRISTHLAHPPFTFDAGVFTPGTLEAVGLIGGRAVAAHRVRTPGASERLVLTADLRGRKPSRRGKDVLFVHAALQDAHGTTVASAFENVAYGIVGDGRLVGLNPLATDAGISSILLETPTGPHACSVHALAVVRAEGGAHVLGASLGVAGEARPFTLHYTIDGSAPTARSARSMGPISSPQQVRAALVVAGRVVATLDEGAAKYRIPVSAPPTTREPFHRS